MRSANVLRIASLAAAAALTAACGASQPAPAETQSGVVAATAKLGVFTSDSNGFDTHSYYYDTGEEVVVFDAQFTEDFANKAIAQIHAETTHPITYVVVTHPNPDKFNGAPAFQKEGAKVIASKATARAIPEVHAYKKNYFVNVAHSFTDATYPAEASIDETFEGETTLHLRGGATIRLAELRHSAVATTQTVAYIPRAHALVVGDVVHHNAHAWLEGGIVDGKPSPDLASWKLALDELRAWEGATVYGGRGEPAPVETAVADEQAYLDGMNALVTSYVQDLGDRKSELSGPNAGDHYKAIAARAQSAYPDYALPYMIEYGVYGLVNQIAASQP